jgi:hypothetical protein
MLLAPGNSTSTFIHLRQERLLTTQSRYYQPNATSLFASTQQPFAEPAHPENPESFSELNVQSNVSTSKLSSPDTALTAFCQLVSWRTGTQRAMIRSFYSLYEIPYMRVASLSTDKVLQCD